jgi:hypothetical protein
VRGGDLESFGIKNETTRGGLLLISNDSSIEPLLIYGPATVQDKPLLLGASYNSIFSSG